MVLDWMCYVGCCSQIMRSNEEDLCQVHWSLAEVFSPVKRVLEYGWKLDFKKKRIFDVQFEPSSVCHPKVVSFEILNMTNSICGSVDDCSSFEHIWAILFEASCKGICFTGLRRFEHGQRDSAARVQGLVAWWGWQPGLTTGGFSTCEANFKPQGLVFERGISMGFMI